MQEMKTAIGMMSGTSMDGIDVALVRTDGRGAVELGATMAFSYETAFSQRVEQALKDASHIEQREERPGDLAALETEITYRHGEAVRAFLEEQNLTAGQIDLIGFHGQTVVHRPEQGLTVQLGDGAALAAKTGIDVVYDMRARDMENGGQGAPLIPVFHRALTGMIEEADQGPVAFVNIGGIANVTFVGAGDPVAFDCGPGNALIDQWVQKHTNQLIDEGGQLGLEGSVDESVLADYLAAPFFEKAVPKSLDRNDFTLGGMPDMDAKDGAATLAALTAHGIFGAAKNSREKPGKWIVAGGGAHNQAILTELRRLAGEDAVMTADACGLSGDFLEAQAWAYLAVRSQRGLALSYPSTTGCVEPVCGGVFAKAP